MMSATLHSLSVSGALAGCRLDKFLAAALPELSRSRAQALIAGGHVQRGGKACTDAAAKVKSDEEITVSIPPPEPSVIVAQDIPLDIVYEDGDLLVINKPPGLTVHPAPGNRSGTLVNALLAHCKGSLSGIGGVERPGIVHRIDKDTSGLLVVAKHDAAHASLSKQLAARTLKRTYLALVWGAPKTKEGTVTGPIGRSPRDRKKMAVLKTGGKEAVTHYRMLDHFPSPSRGEGQDGSEGGSKHPLLYPPPSRGRNPDVSLLECRLQTGRTHQIRVHMAQLGCPLVGDQTYGKVPPSLRASEDSRIRAFVEFQRQALHAFRLELVHPSTSETMRFEAPLPGDLLNLLNVLDDLS